MGYAVSGRAFPKIVEAIAAFDPRERGAGGAAPEGRTGRGSGPATG